MRSANKLIILLCCLFVVSPAMPQIKASIIYQAPLGQTEVAVQKLLQASSEIESAVALINDTFELKEPLNITFGGKDGPLFDSESNSILFPYTFIEEVESRFVTAHYENTGRSIHDATMDAVMHTLFHELAHVLISMHALPIVGKEEDAADSLASLLLITFFNDGQEIAISAADLFDLESADIETFEDDDFWDEHSLNLQRYYSTLCHVYGSAPEEYAHITEVTELSEERAELCIEEYENLSNSWFTILAPYIKNDADIPRQAQH